MAEDRTIEEIQRSFARFKDEIDSVEKDLRDLIAGFEREARAPAVDPEAAAGARARDHRGQARRRRAGPADQQSGTKNFGTGRRVAHGRRDGRRERPLLTGASTDGDRPRRSPWTNWTTRTT